MKALYLSALDCSHDLIRLRKGKYNWYLFVKRGGDFIQYFRLETFEGGTTHKNILYGEGILPTLYIQTDRHRVALEGVYMSSSFFKGEFAYRFRGVGLGDGLGGSILIRERGAIGSLEDSE